MTEAAKRVSYADVAGTCVARAYVAALALDSMIRAIEESAERIRAAIDAVRRGEHSDAVALLYSALVWLEDTVKRARDEKKRLEEIANSV